MRGGEAEMSTDTKELVKRFRSNEVAALPEHIRAFVFAAADALEAMAGEVERLKTDYEELCKAVGCPKTGAIARLEAAEAERDRLAGEVTRLKGKLKRD